MDRFLSLWYSPLPPSFNPFTMKIPGVSFSWKRALGISEAKRKISKETGIPLTKGGLQRKIGASIIKAIFKK